MNANQTKAGEGRKAPKTFNVAEIATGIVHEDGKSLNKMDARVLAVFLNQRSGYNRFWVISTVNPYVGGAK